MAITTSTPQPPRTQIQGLVTQQLEETLSHLPGALGGGARQEDAELVAAIAVEAVMGAAQPLGGVGHGFQQKAAHGMAMAGVHALEVVHVKEEQSQGFRLGRGRPHSLWQFSLQTTPILRHGEIVFEGQGTALLQLPGIEQQRFHVIEAPQELFRRLLGIGQAQDAQLSGWCQKKGFALPHEISCLLRR